MLLAAEWSLALAWPDEGVYRDELERFIHRIVVPLALIKVRERRSSELDDQAIRKTVQEFVVDRNGTEFGFLGGSFSPRRGGGP